MSKRTDPGHGKKWGPGRTKTSKHIALHKRRKLRQERALERGTNGKSTASNSHRDSSWKEEDRPEHFKSRGPTKRT